jgi:site-specific DNA-methyltransferase (adenine-specific)
MKVYSGYKSIRLDNKMMGVPLIKSKELPSKSLCQIPSRFAIEMLNRSWILRNMIIWHKPNCMPQSVKDRFTVDFEYLFFFVKSKRYWFAQQHETLRNEERLRRRFFDPNNVWRKRVYGDDYIAAINPKTAEQSRARTLKVGRNKRCVWTIGTKAFSGAHFAVYPEELCVTPILASCPKGGIVLDPFMGSGTTAVVARKLGRNYVGIELNPKYIALAEKRLAQVT